MVQKKASPAQVAQADRVNATEFGRRIGTELRDRGVSDMDLVAEAVREACLGFAGGFVAMDSPRYDVLSQTCADEAVATYAG